MKEEKRKENAKNGAEKRTGNKKNGVEKRRGNAKNGVDLAGEKISLCSKTTKKNADALL